MDRNVQEMRARRGELIRNRRELISRAKDYEKLATGQAKLASTEGLTLAERQDHLEKSANAAEVAHQARASILMIEKEMARLDNDIWVEDFKRVATNAIERRKGTALTDKAKAGVIVPAAVAAKVEQAAFIKVEPVKAAPLSREEREAKRRAKSEASRVLRQKMAGPAGGGKKGKGR